MAKKPGRDSGNPILNSPYEEPEAHDADHAGNTPVVPLAHIEDWNIPTAEEDEEDEAVHRQFIRAQEGSMRRFWEETKDDNL